MAFAILVGIAGGWAGFIRSARARAAERHVHRREERARRVMRRRRRAGAARTTTGRCGSPPTRPSPATSTTPPSLPHGVTTTFASRRPVRRAHRRTGWRAARLRVRYTFGVRPSSNISSSFRRTSSGAEHRVGHASPDEGRAMVLPVPGRRIAHNDDCTGRDCGRTGTTVRRVSLDDGEELRRRQRVASRRRSRRRMCRARRVTAPVGARRLEGRVSLLHHAASRWRVRALSFAPHAVHRRLRARSAAGRTHRIALLDTELYHPDGQIAAVFEYGSFVQSKMYARGVTCSDCHDPHSATLKQPDGERRAGERRVLAVSCAEKYRHRSITSIRRARGADCIGCHMPTTTYMVVDQRHDHSIRVPRPDLSVSIGVPNACNKCHTTRSPSWAGT